MKNYIYIRAWARLTGAGASDLHDQLLDAKIDEAPPFALYKDASSNSWITLDELTDEGVAQHVEEIAERLRRIHD